MEQELQPSSRPVRYFVEEKLVFVIESTQPWPLDTAARREYLREIMPGFMSDRLRLEGAELNHIAIFDRQALFLDNTEFAAPDDSMSAVTAFAFVTVKHLDDNTLIHKVAEFQAELRAGAGVMLAQDPPLFVTAISPDWLASTAAEQDGTGGPGGRPVAWPESDTTPPYKLVPEDEFTGCRDALKELLEADCQREVDVAILDTAPSQCVLQDAYRFWGPGGGGKEHPLVNTLLKPDQLAFQTAQFTNNTKMWVCYASAANYPDNPEMSRLNSPSGYGRIVEHAYRMPDHGLFVAGIIHSLVPQARLYLIQVINDWGICSIASIVAGLEKLVEVRAHMGRRVPLVINLSLVLSLPREKAHQAAHADRGPDWLETHHDSAFYEDMSALFKKIADLLSGTPNSIIVAAAGNDGGKRAPAGNAPANQPALPKARYPAAFPRVTGVGALERVTRDPTNQRVKADYTPYSNAADDPQNKGFVTFGGKIEPGNAPDHAKADKTDGILGIYTGDFPDGTLNRNGWARWAGTSFATPVIAGLITKLLCVNESLRPADAEKALRDLVAEASSAEAEIVPMRHPS